MLPARRALRSPELRDGVQMARRPAWPGAPHRGPRELRWWPRLAPNRSSSVAATAVFSTALTDDRLRSRTGPNLSGGPSVAPGGGDWSDMVSNPGRRGKAATACTMRWRAQHCTDPYGARATAPAGDIRTHEKSCRHLNKTASRIADTTRRTLRSSVRVDYWRLPAAEIAEFRDNFASRSAVLTQCPPWMVGSPGS